MDCFAWPRLPALAASLAALLLVAFPGAGTIPSAAAAGVVIHGPEETLRDYCEERDGALWLLLPDGSRHELVISTTDPLIVNSGDGSFHPYEEREVRAALQSLRTPLAPLSAEVFLLPFPRRAGLESAAAPGLILLSPGVRPLTPEHQHAEFVHELGHVVQYARLPDGATDEWNRYRELRGISDESLYNATAQHADRPREIFAEDFRALIGGALANYSGTIENAALAPPATVAGLPEFMWSVATEGGPARSVLSCYPNPSRGGVRFARAGEPAEALEIYDVAGRRLATLAPAASAGLVTWRWDGRDGSGADAGAGVFFARTRTGSATLRVTRVR